VKYNIIYHINLLPKYSEIGDSFQERNWLLSPSEIDEGCRVNQHRNFLLRAERLQQLMNQAWAVDKNQE